MRCIRTKRSRVVGFVLWLWMPLACPAWRKTFHFHLWKILGERLAPHRRWTMACFEEEVVRAYFEENGFLVRSAGHPPEAGKKRVGSLPTLAILNPEVKENATNFSFRLFTTDIGRIRAAIVSVLGWDSITSSASRKRITSRPLSHFGDQPVP